MHDFDAVRFLEDATELVDHHVQGEAGLLGLRRVVDVGHWTLGASAVAFVEFGPVTGRVVAASGTATTELGRRVSSGDAALRALLADTAIIAVDLADLPADLRLPLDGHQVLLGRVDRHGWVIGALAAYLPADLDPDDKQRLALFKYLRSVATRLYRDSPGLPLHGDPGVHAPTDSTLLLDADGLICWISPRSRVTAGMPEVALGAPLPLPLPGPGQVLEHQLADGRWLTIVAKHLPAEAGESVTIRDVTEARRWEQSRELFVALTSHELRTPVTVIKGYADTLNDRWDVLDDHGRRHAASVLGQRAGELARLLDRLLSAVGEPGIPPVVSRFDLGAAMRAAVDALPEDTRCRVRITLPPALPTVFGEHVSIASVISELVMNAGKYAPVSAGPIEVEAHFDDRTVGFRVTDRGIGVRPEHVESAFERFWQADTGDHRRYGGVGLGLYLVRRIVERQNGSVSLRPRESGGTVAEVRLPRGDLIR
jgi:two-component system phosphate regulon sensor histidine kinase PhoR